MQEITKIIYSNNFFNVIKVENNLQLDNILDEREAVIMILLEGKIYFYNERILKEKQYIISKVENVLKGIKILSNNYKMIIITLKESFLKEMGIFKIEKTIHTNLDNYCAELIRNLKEEYLLENPCYPIEVIVKFFKIHNFLSEETLKYFNILEKNKYQKVFKIIETNIKLLPEDIEKKFLKV